MISDLYALHASQQTIDQELRRLHELKKVIVNDVRRDVLKKIRRQSIKATSFKENLGLGRRGHRRSRSFAMPSEHEEKLR